MKLNPKIFTVPKLSGPIFNSNSNSDLESLEKYCCTSFCTDKSKGTSASVAMIFSVDV